MTALKNIDPDDIPLYAMHLLPAEQSKELGQRLKHDTEAKRVLSEVYGDLAVLALSVDGQSFTAQARARFIGQVSREKRYVSVAERAPASGHSPTSGRAYPPVSAVTGSSVTGSSVPEQSRRPAGISRVLPWLGWAVAAGLALEAGVLYQQRRGLERAVEVQRAQLAQTMTAAELASQVVETLSNPAAKTVVLTPGEGRIPPQGRAIYDPDKGSLIFIANNLEPLSPTKIYELWLLPADGSAPVAAGTFHPDAHGNASVLLPQIPKGTVAKGFGITVENGTGSPTPTLPIILKGAAA